MTPARTRDVTLRDVARESGFSPATVSIVLNNAPLARYIPAATKEKIRRAARQLRYRPNLFARSLKSRRSHAVGVMVCDMTDPYCTLILRGLESALYERTYLPILTDFRNQQARFERHLELLFDRQVEGLIVLANWLFLDINLLADVERRRIPAVLIGRELAGGSRIAGSVTVDNEAGAARGLEHLLSLGHRRIAFLRGPKEVADSAERWQGIRQAARAAGLELDPRLVRELPSSEDPLSGFTYGERQTAELLAAGRPFTALMAFDDLTAFGALRALARAGRRVPQDCSVIGFDDVPSAALYTPSLTTLRQPMEKMGALAAQLLLDAIDASLKKAEIVPARRRMAPELVVRESTGRAPQG